MLPKIKKQFEGKSTKEVMTTIYTNKLCGSLEGSDFNSGSGSHNNTVINPYIEQVKKFLNSTPEKLKVCDFGCGDFNVGSNLVSSTSMYIACDIVEPLIERNKIEFQAHNLEFKCLDLVTDPLPDADCAIIRQVLQHLSNDEIKIILKKLQKYKYLIITEHLPYGEFTANQDKKTGPDIRIYHNSGIVLTEAPFNLRTLLTKELVSVDDGQNSGCIVTNLYALS